MSISNKTHQGRNVKRFREMLGIKQEALAIRLGEDWHQKRISLLEAKDELEPELLVLVANALKVPEEIIRKFDEASAVSYFNTFVEESINNTPFAPKTAPNNECSFNPLDKLIAVLDENKMLYERLLASEREKVEILKERY